MFNYAYSVANSPNGLCMPQNWARHADDADNSNDVFLKLEAGAL